MTLLSLFLYATTLTAPLPSDSLTPPESMEASQRHNSIFRSLFETSYYFGAGALLGSATVITRVASYLCEFTPQTAAFSKECLLASDIFLLATLRSCGQIFKKSLLTSLFFKPLPPSDSAWDLHQRLFAQIPAFSLEDCELLSFLQRHWLAKTTGCYPFLVDWLCPTFGISLQVHPETTNSYARDPSNKPSDTYRDRIEAWKNCLPHPRSFPLILTRPSNICDYLPRYFEVVCEENLESTIESIALLDRSSRFPVVLDLTALVSNEGGNTKSWLQQWRHLENKIAKGCNQYRLDSSQLLCIDRLRQKELGGIRLLPFLATPEKAVAQQYEYLLEWISRFGLSANRIELDRFTPALNAQSGSSRPAAFALSLEPLERWISFVDECDRNWCSTHLQKSLMVKGTLQVLHDLLTRVTPQQWQQLQGKRSRALSAQLSFNKIKGQLQQIFAQDAAASFHETASLVEQIHADLASLLEIFAPFRAADFPTYFRRHLMTIPTSLQPLTQCALHTSGMTSLGGIFKAVEKSLGRAPCILYGENTYFECIHAAEKIGRALSTQEASEEEWGSVDLLLAQFNPTVKRINFKVTEYQVAEYHLEKVAAVVQRALNKKRSFPLTLALDCTLDYSDSAKLGELLDEFQDAIAKGALIVICYRSGLKFDLFGMDNYCGAPFFMIHNASQQCSSFDFLLHDPALQTDRLSLNWFCLIYQHATPYLELYRKQIFENTRAVLDRAPARLFSTSGTLNYRIIPMAEAVDPSFIDIKIFGPLHAIRGGLLVGVFLTLKCMESGYPLLFRPSIGFYHPNLAVLFGKECTTVRLTLGLDPGQVDVVVRCLEAIDALND